MPSGKFPNFACVGAAGTDLWPDTPSEGWGQDNAVGRERANDLLAVMRRTDNPALLGHVVEAIGKRGVYAGIETGFFHELSIILMQPAVREIVEIPSRHPHSAKMGHLRVVA